MHIINTTGLTKRERKIVEASHGQTEWCKPYLIVQSAYSRFPQKFGKYPYGRRSVILPWLSLRRTWQSQPSCTYWRGVHRKNDFLGKAFGTVVFQVSNFSFIFRCLHSRQRKEPLREYEEKLRTRWARSHDFSNIAVLVQQQKWIYSLSSLALSDMIYYLLENYQMILLTYIQK